MILNRVEYRNAVSFCKKEKEEESERKRERW